MQLQLVVMDLEHRQLKLDAASREDRISGSDDIETDSQSGADKTDDRAVALAHPKLIPRLNFGAIKPTDLLDRMDLMEKFAIDSVEQPRRTLGVDVDHDETLSRSC